MLADGSRDTALRLNDSDASVRRIAVLDLLEFSDDDAVVPLLLKALRDTSGGVRAEAARALEGFERADVIEALLQSLFDDDEEARRSAASTLAELKDAGEIADAAAIPALERALDDPDADVRKFASAALRTIVAKQRV